MQQALIADEFNPKLQFLNLICLKHRRLRIEVEIEVRCCFFMVQTLISSQILKKGIQRKKFCVKVVEF